MEDLVVNELGLFISFWVLCSIVFTLLHRRDEGKMPLGMWILCLLLMPFMMIYVAIENILKIEI